MQSEASTPAALLLSKNSSLEVKIKMEKKELHDLYHACRIAQRAFHGPVRPFE